MRLAAAPPAGTGAAAAAEAASAAAGRRGDPQGAERRGRDRPRCCRSCWRRTSGGDAATCCRASGAFHSLSPRVSPRLSRRYLTNHHCDQMPQLGTSIGAHHIVYVHKGFALNLTSRGVLAMLDNRWQAFVALRCVALRKVFICRFLIANDFLQHVDTAPLVFPTDDIAAVPGGLPPMQHILDVEVSDDEHELTRYGDATAGAAAAPYGSAAVMESGDPAGMAGEATRGAGVRNDTIEVMPAAQETHKAAEPGVDLAVATSEPAQAGTGNPEEIMLAD